MPAERTRTSRSTGATETEQAWSIESQSPAPSCGNIAFAPNITPGTFHDPPPQTVDAPVACESVLFPPVEDSNTQRRPGHSRKKPENHIPRPPNAFILFRSSFIKSQHVSTEVETNHSTLSKIIGLTWQNLPNEERQIWHAKAKIALDEHKRKFPQYAFKPSHGKSRGTAADKRKVREVGPKDHKRCAKIAELLVKGKKGQELDAAIQEFDKHHVPEVITRFEAPITANMYSRSTSMPASDFEDPKDSSTAASSSSSGRKLRTSSPQPRLHISSSPAATGMPEEQRNVVPEALFDNSSLEQYSLASQIDSHPRPSFDFNTFVFDNFPDSMPNFPCNALTQDINGFVAPTSSDLRSRQLSIDTSFLDTDSWTRSSSPLSAASPMSSSSCSMPPTPSYSPSPDSYGSYTLEATTPDFSMAKAFGEMAQYPIYSAPFMQCEGYSDNTSNFGNFQQQEHGSQIVQADLDFSAFMASLPPYSL